MVRLPAGPGDAKAEARVFVEKEGTRLYRVVLDLYLTAAQVAACQVPERP